MNAPAKSPSRPVSETARLLREARAVIRLKKHWCQNSLALDSHGKEVDFDSRKAVKWCAVGALEVATKRSNQWPSNPLHRAALQLGSRGFIALNNETDHKTTLKMFTLAAKLAEQEDRAKRKSQLKEKGRDNHAK